MATASKKLKRDSRLESSKSTEEKDTRSLCQRVECPTFKLSCVLEVCQDCINRKPEDKTSHVWTHLSYGEHVCHYCVDFYAKSHGIGNENFLKWKKVWSNNARSEPLPDTFISDQALPYWAQCIRCNKWREMGRYFNLNKELAENFICMGGCDEAEDERVEVAKQMHWINSLLYPPYLTQSPAEIFLKGYYPDAVGMSASECQPSESRDNFCRPFHEPNSTLHALSVRPDVMDLDETLEFREFACVQQMYLCLRNLVMAMWHINPTEWLTLDKCRHSLICRGLVRVRCVQELERVLAFLTLKGVINSGILPQPPPSVFCQRTPPLDVVIVGAGMAGLAAALHLYKHGIKATVLEAKERLGGRIHNSRLSSGSLLSLGPDIISGSINNPVSLMARQAKLIIQEFPVSTIAVLGRNNKPVNPDCARRAENRFLHVLDVMYDWANSSDDSDCSLEAKAGEIYKSLDEDEEEKLSEDEMLLYQMHMKMLAVSLGAELDKVSAKHWNSYEKFPQFTGPSFVLKQGLGSLLMKMAGGLGIEYNKKVRQVIQLGDKMEIVCSDQSRYICDKVVLAVSASVLQSGIVHFQPPLGESKLSALTALGYGQVEKVVLHYKKKFWSPKVHGARLFTCLSILSDPTVPSHLFYDMSSNAGHVLCIYLHGEQVKLLYGQSADREEEESKIGAMCTELIKKMFPNAPGPLTISVSRWCVDPDVGMSHGYLPVGSSPDIYRTLAEPLVNKMYFAGEAFVESHPHSIPGSYISGVQQAIRILEGS